MDHTRLTHSGMGISSRWWLDFKMKPLFYRFSTKPKANPCEFIAAEETPIGVAICTLPFYPSGRNPDTISTVKWIIFFSNRAAKWLPPYDQFYHFLYYQRCYCNRFYQFLRHLQTVTWAVLEKLYVTSDLDALEEKIKNSEFDMDLAFSTDILRHN